MHAPSPMTFVSRGTMWILLGLSLLCLSIKSGMASAFSPMPPPTGVYFPSYSPSCLFHRDGNQRRQRQLHFSASDCSEDGDEKPAGENTGMESSRRRELLRRLTGVLVTASIVASGPSVAKAGEVGARITKAVTTSDLGISVRTSVVKGAQLADKIDGQWEKFSDTYGLGSERTKQVGRRPKDKTIPDPLPLNTDAAQKILDISDEVFLKLMPAFSPQKLTTRIENISKSAMPSFERSGVVFSVNKEGSNNSNYENVAAADLLRFETAPQFNFAVYAHFKAYSELILEKGNSINFANFRIEFERSVGQRLIETFQLANTASKGFARQEQQTNAVLKNQLLAALEQTDTLSRRLRELGLVANVDRNSIESTDDLQDFRIEFERSVGQRLIETFQLANTASKGFARQEQQTNAVLKNQLLAALEQTDTLSRRLRELGLVANVDRNSIESTDDLQDFVDDALADLIITVSVDGDVTLQAQILLQEQGYRLYPNFNRFVVTEFFREAISLPNGNSGNDDGSHKVSVMDYYFDTNYNSDPDKFEVKQVLLNISIE
jgi:hypothetical protein